MPKIGENTEGVIKLDFDKKAELDFDKKNAQLRVEEKKRKKRNDITEHRTAANPPQKPTHKGSKRRVCGSATVQRNRSAQPDK